VTNRAKLFIAPTEDFTFTSLTANDEPAALKNDTLTKTIVKTISFVIRTEDADSLAKPKKALSALIEKGNLYDSFAKTEKSFKALTAAIAAADSVLTSDKATTLSLTTAGENINKAIEGLTLEEGYSYLTPEMFKKYASVEEPGEGEETDCTYELFNTSRVLYGDVNNNSLKWADLSGYDQLILTTVGNGDMPRFCMNNEVSTKFEINPYGGANEATTAYQTIEANRYIIDLKKIVEDHEFAHLHSIQVNDWGTGAFLNGMYLYKAPFVAVTKVTLDNTEAVIVYGETLKLTATVAPEDATEPTVTWESGDETVATVDQTGMVTPVKVGTVVIKATAGECSATCTLKVYPQLGDAKLDGDITLADALHIANYVVGKNTVKDEMKEFFMAGADANKDNSISISDASATAEIALKNDPAPAAKAKAVAALNAPEDNLLIGALNASADGASTVAVTLDNSMDYVALQADIYVPEGVNFEVKPGSRIADSHFFQSYRFDDSHVRVAIYTFSGNAFADNNEPMFEIVTDSSLADPADISLVKILASDSDANEYVLGSRVAGTSGIAAPGVDNAVSVMVFDLNGIYVSDTMEGLGQGTYIVRRGNEAKKVQIR
ncbi:MAG: Ig-like domain-containing protein, partial [Muribaculaceae bacterium]|nr:Ig-like domain-containing protein [Muribaculaceae bacterium]